MIKSPARYPTLPLVKQPHDFRGRSPKTKRNVYDEGWRKIAVRGVERVSLGAADSRA